MDIDNKNIKDINIIEEVPFKKRIFNFYFFTLLKKDIGIFFYIFFFILETIQLCSYSFSEPHLNNWHIKENKIEDISLIIGYPRITPIMKYLKKNIYLIIYCVLCVYVFSHCLLLMMLIKFNKTNSKIYILGITITRLITTPLTIFLFIPILELIMLPLKCENDYVVLLKDSIKCWDKLHYLYAILSIIFALAFYCLIILSTLFYFNPFNKSATTKINNSSDSFLYLTKVILVCKWIWIKNENLSGAIMFVFSLFNFLNSFSKPTYNKYLLECFISIRNAIFFWSNFILMVNLLAGRHLKGNIYLLIFGYPLIIFFSIIYYRSKSSMHVISISNLNDVNEYLKKTNQLVKLIEYYIEYHKAGNKSNNNKAQDSNRFEILLKGAIAIHEESCIDEECPLKKFLDNPNNYTIQKTSLLHYMNNYFSVGIKKFPNCRMLLLSVVQFNYENKYNLNFAKNYLNLLEKSKNSLSEDYLIHCIKQNIASLNKLNDLNKYSDILKLEETIEQKYQRLKFLIETTTKLYGEFWGIFAANLTNNLNLSKLFVIGNKLNKNIKEIHSLWDNELKNKKIDIENQSIAQLYAYFLREIIRNKKKSEEITKKLNEEQHYESRKIDEDKFDINNLDILLENQDLIIYSRCSEKGEGNIIQCSNSIVYLLGYVKQDLIGNPIETLMPTIYVKGHNKMLAKRLKGIHNQLLQNKNNFRAADKKQTFLLPKTKVGYLVPLNCRFTVYNDDDFSNTYIVKCRYENKDTKSVYAFYVLTKDDFTVDSISSSAINLGLSMDLLKKYVINMNILVRSENNLESIDLFEKYKEYEEEPKKVTWIIPDVIYPKNDTLRSKEEDINELIKISKTKEYLLNIYKLKYEEDETLGYCFRFSDSDSKRSNVLLEDFHFNTNKHVFFDLLKLSFLRGEVVEQHQGKNLANLNKILRSSLADELNQKKENDKIEKKTTKKKKKKKNENDENVNNDSEENNDEEDDEDKIQENILTKEKILEMQSKRSDEIKSFIFTLPFYGSDVSLEKHRPNKEKYPVGKTQEPSIKINISGFIKRIEEKLKSHPDLKKKLEQAKQNLKSINNLEESSISASSSGNSLNNSLSTADITTAVSVNSTSSQSEFSSDTSATLGNIFNEHSVFYISVFSVVFFILILFYITSEFALSLYKINNTDNRMGYMDKGFILLNTIVYTKFFLTEIILTNDNENEGREYKIIDNNLTPDEYKRLMMLEMAQYREIFSNTWLYYSNATVTFSKEYRDYTDTTMLNIKTLSNNEETTEEQLFSIAMSRIPTSIFYVSTVTNNPNNIIFENRNSFELMSNLLNDYLLVWRHVTFLLVDDVKDHAEKSFLIDLVFALSWIVDIITLIILWKLIKRFINDREKPIDLFLTIKKRLFEELKNSSENFTNKLLNKFFGNEDNEEEAMIDNNSNIKPDDINIVKFKTKNEHKQSYQSNSEYLWNYMKLVIFFILIQIYMVFKYIYNDNNLKSMNKFITVFNATHYSQSDLLISLNAMKSYYYNSSIEIFNNDDTEAVFYDIFVSLSDKWSGVLKETYNTSCFLRNKYVNIFYEYCNNDINDIIYFENATKINDDTKESLYLGTLQFGFKAVLERFFELLRYIAINKMLDDKGMLDIKEEEKIEFTDYIEFKEINNIVRNVIRPWFNEVIKIMNDEFNNFVDQIKVINIAMFIIVFCTVLILYVFVWKSYEDNLKTLLKTAVALINLIPEEIKYMIVVQLNEEENKNP